MKVIKCTLFERRTLTDLICNFNSKVIYLFFVVNYFLVGEYLNMIIDFFLTCAFSSPLFNFLNLPIPAVYNWSPIYYHCFLYEMFIDPLKLSLIHI